MRIERQVFRQIERLWLAVVGLGLLTCAGMSAEAALRAMAQHPAEASTAAQAEVRGYEADDHFPGAALLYAETAGAAPGRGTTGTTALPALPVPAAIAQALAGAEAGVAPARPFSLALAGSADRARALDCLTSAIYYEAGSEPDAGQQAVAQVVLNRVRHPAFPATVCGVVFQGSERAGCQFSFACDGAMGRVRSASGWARATRVAAAALAGYVYAPVGLATHYHTYAVTPAWNRSLVMTDMVGAHLFHRWKGFWGTAAAFTQVYRGGEPAPGVHVVVSQPVTEPIPFTEPVVTKAALRPALADSGVALPTVVGKPDRLPAAPVVLDRWADAGTLRQAGR